eukprot:gene17280-5361_t
MCYGFSFDNLDTCIKESEIATTHMGYTVLVLMGLIFLLIGCNVSWAGLKTGHRKLMAVSCAINA